MLVLVACGGTPTPQNEVLPALDLAAQLGPGQSRAGFVNDPNALWGGISAEGATGDIKIYNDRVRFVIQARGESDFYLPQGGHVVDADIVRDAGEPGRDLVDEWVGMAGLGRLMDAVSVNVIDDGRDSGTAVVEATGYESPLHLLEGAIEAHGQLIPDLGLTLTHRYTLPADSWLMRVDTTVTSSDQTATFNIGDAIMGAADAASWWGPGNGYGGLDEAKRPWNGYIGDRNESAFGIFSGDGADLGTAGLQLLTDLINLAAGFDETGITMQPDQVITYTRYYGIGPDFATLSDAWLEMQGMPTEVVASKAVDNEGTPVAGARVSIWVDDALYTLAITDDQGLWSAQVPIGSSVRWLTDGRGPGLHYDLPPGAAHHGPYAAAPAQAIALDALSNGAAPVAIAEGYGVATEATPDLLTKPTLVTVAVADGGPFEVRWDLVGEPVVDDLAVQPRPWGHTAAAWARDGEVTLPLEAGTYDVIIHRGSRYERDVRQVVVEAGLPHLRIDTSLPKAFDHTGYLFGDPHVHASPSPDGRISMEHRVVNMAGVGSQLHFGTDHDHVVDYGMLVEPLGLGAHINSVIATEMSPVLRGHLNLYPLQTRGDLPNGGGYAWFRNQVENTSEQMALLRERHGGELTEGHGFSIQANHPIGVGLADLGGWSPGTISNPDFWSSDFNAIEALNGGSYEDYLPLYFDLVNRGHEVTPTGTSDSHRPFSGDPGLNGTYIWFNSDEPSTYTPDGLRRAWIDHHVIVSRGLFLEMNIPPGSTITGATSLQVTARGASWAAPNRLRLYRDGVEVETVEAAEATFHLVPDADASYVVIAEGDVSMSPLWGSTPWAMSAAIKIDLDGEGWTAPLPPLVLED
jgi:hypothetical protein